jgi:hypothetical protein
LIFGLTDKRGSGYRWNGLRIEFDRISFVFVCIRVMIHALSIVISVCCVHSAGPVEHIKPLKLNKGKDIIFY